MASDTSRVEILIVDDNPADIELYRRLLRAEASWKHTIRAAETGEDGLAEFRRSQPDCVLLDYNIPDLDGIEFLEQLGAEELQSCAIVIVTGQGNERVAAETLRKGAQDYLVKGVITGEGLVKTIENGMEKITLRRQILEKNRILEESNKALERFAYVAAHDLQSPLRTIQGFADILQEEAGSRLSAEELEYVEYIRKGTNRMSALIGDILALSRVSHQKYKFETIDLTSLVETVIDDMNAEIKAARATVTCSDLPVIVGDRSHLYSLLLNLIGNGLKYNDSGAPLIEVLPVEDVHAYHLVVRDNGIGIPLEKIEEVFGAFQRLGGLPKISGTGLGLSICRQIVERHGGKIWVESAPGSGSAFHFTLPMRLEEHATLPAGEGPGSAGGS